jgi:NTE family protein
MDFTISSRGFIKGDKVFGELKKLIADCQIEDLNIPFVCTAVEIPSGKEHVFRKGSLYAAIRASVSIPTVLTPAKIHGKEYIDGGILNPIPLSLLPKEKRGEIVLAVDLNGPKEVFVNLIEEKDKIILPPTISKLPNWMIDYQKKFSTYFSILEKDEKPKGMGFIDLMNYSFDILQDKFSELVLEKHQVDIIVEISRTQAKTLEFHRASEMIEIGKQKTLKAIAQFENESQKT